MTTPALSFALNTQNANLVFAGPVSGSAATPTYRALVAADLPTITPPTGAGFWGGLFFSGPVPAGSTTAAGGRLAVCGSQAGAGGFQAVLFLVPVPISIAKVTWNVTTGVASTGTMDVGLYTAAGTLVASVNPAAANATAASTGSTVSSLTQGTVTLTPGYYYFAQTANSTSIKATCWVTDSEANDFDEIWTSGGGGSGTNNMWVFATGTSGGVLPSTMPTWTNGSASGGQPGFVAAYFRK